MVSKTAWLMRVWSATGTGRVSKPRPRSMASSTGPVAPPERKTGSVGPPSSAITRLTLMPPPPGSYRSSRVRILRVGRTASASAAPSMQGLSVSVTMGFMASRWRLRLREA